MEFRYQAIGFLETPFLQAEGSPIQPSGALGVRGRLRLLPEYAAGLADLEGFSHIIVLYHLHQAKGHCLTVTPFLDAATHGVFATRAPRRPNPVGLSVLRLTKIAGNVLDLENVDMLDGSPVIDIKPYVAAFDACPDSTAGWLEDRAKAARDMRADRRFADAHRTRKEPEEPDAFAEGADSGGTDGENAAGADAETARGA